MNCNIVRFHEAVNYNKGEHNLSEYLKQQVAHVSNHKRQREIDQLSSIFVERQIPTSV
ncbi:unnamed protein product [Absidia cylindrospora]